MYKWLFWIKPKICLTQYLVFNVNLQQIMKKGYKNKVKYVWYFLDVAFQLILTSGTRTS